MQIVRTILWVALTAILVAFIAMNWTPVAVNIWPLEDGNFLHFQWPVGVVAILFFALGFAPVWLMARANRWRLNRRISALENSVRATSVSPSIPAALPATTPETTAPPETTA